jgi:hypothetical protein
MSKKQPSEELSWEDAVAGYLEAHPDYFESRPDILTALTLSHPDTGKAISLIERQVAVLRDKNHALQQQLRELVSIARENDVLGERLHRFAVAMVDAGSLDDVLETAQGMLRQDFRLEAVAVLLRGEAADRVDRPEFTAAQDKKFGALLAQSDGKRAVCGGKLDREMLTYLFGRLAADVKSTALIPLKDARHEGMLCLGSNDAYRFHPEMGTVYLMRLGELLMCSAGRYLM